MKASRLKSKCKNSKQRRTFGNKYVTEFSVPPCVSYRLRSERYHAIFGIFLRSSDANSKLFLFYEVPVFIFFSSFYCSDFCIHFILYIRRLSFSKTFFTSVVLYLDVGRFTLVSLIYFGFFISFTSLPLYQISIATKRGATKCSP